MSRYRWKNTLSQRLDLQKPRHRRLAVHLQAHQTPPLQVTVQHAAPQQPTPRPLLHRQTVQLLLLHAQHQLTHHPSSRHVPASQTEKTRLPHPHSSTALAQELQLGQSTQGVALEGATCLGEFPHPARRPFFFPPLSDFFKVGESNAKLCFGLLVVNSVLFGEVLKQLVDLVVSFIEVQLHLLDFLQDHLGPVITSPPLPPSATLLQVAPQLKERCLAIALQLGHTIAQRLHLLFHPQELGLVGIVMRQLLDFQLNRPFELGREGADLTGDQVLSSGLPCGPVGFHFFNNLLYLAEVTQKLLQGQLLPQHLLHFEVVHLVRNLRLQQFESRILLVDALHDDAQHIAEGVTSGGVFLGSLE